MLENKQVVFECNKCGHLLFVDVITKDHLQDIMKMDCPNCGEEAEGLWSMLRMGNYEEEYESED